MADTRITKIQVRRGEIANLPLLDAGELGYATDQYRLFLGNESIGVGTGDGSTVDFPLPATSIAALPLTATEANTTFYLDGVEVSGWSIGTVAEHVTFSSAPANGVAITMRVNSEIELRSPTGASSATTSIVPPSLTLSANTTSFTDTAIGGLTVAQSEAFWIQYTLKKDQSTAVLMSPVTSPTVTPGDTIEINGTTVTFTGTTLATVVSDITAAGVIDIAATDVNNQLRLSSQPAVDITLGAGTGTAMTDLGLTAGTTETGKYRIGQIRVIIDSDNNTFSLDDQYNSPESDIQVTFGGDITTTPGVFILTYTNYETVDVTLSYQLTQWNI